MSNAFPMVDVIGYDSGWGCGDYGCEDGPHKVSADSLIQALAQADISTKWSGPLGLKFLGNHAELDSKEKTLPIVVEGLRRLAQSVKETIAAGRMPLVMGGDHACAIGTWSGVVQATDSAEKFGLIWIDAHLDAHTYETSHQGKFGGWWHGQPVSALMGEGLKQLTSLGGNMAKIAPEHISLIGPHSFEPAEVAFVKRHNIRVYDLNEVQQRGFQVVFDESLARATTGTKGFGMTVDLDGFHPNDAPAVGTEEDDGLMAAEVLPVLKSLARHPKFRALEIAEYNPHKDIDGKTDRLITKMVASIFSK